VGITATIASVGLAAGAAGLNYEGTVSKGKGEQAGDNAQADRLDRQAEYGRAAAAETDAQLRENLNVSLGNIDAVRAAQNTDPTSPTTAALRDRTAYIGDRARSIQVGNLNAQADQNESDADYLRQAGSFALSNSRVAALSGVLSSASSAVGKFGAGGAKLGFPGGSPGSSA
jgi:hypothetical protein